ncbi:DEKNAAE105146 [Brettanomyces naardenensis]|uniref:DEKNAAE105147 n=1 Tax=Brettanomyces naardenensis TaxID=13370 RepID=A0A448YSS3_BRENA|nr:DEKNAAE105146 [Brettanomyces naardenensis]
MTSVTQGSIPEVVEKTIGESLGQRTSILDNVNDLGPPDMVHLAKATANSSAKTPSSGTFFYYTGTDTSNSATIAALLHSIADIIDEKPQLWFGKHKAWKVCEATYCSYNAFSRLDSRVKVAFPGGVESCMVDSSGNKQVETDRLWLQTYVSSMVRALVTADNDSSDFTSVVEIRKINPLLTKEGTDLFLDGFEQLFFEGTKLGCSENLQVPTNANNMLVDAFLKCIQITGDYERGLEIIGRLKTIDASVGFLEAQLYLSGDEEVKAVKSMHDAILANPLDGEMLTLQAEYCLDKNRLDLALPIATKAVNSSPSNFKPWSVLVKAYIALGQYEQALLTLNSCPMVTHKDKYILKRINNPRPEDMHLPLPVDVTLDKVSTLNSVDVAVEHNRVDSSLLNLPAANLKSTFAEAYDLLTQIVHKTGWEPLLHYRTKVFVMEEEFKQGGSDESSGGGSSLSPKKLPEATIADEETRKVGTSHGNALDNDFKKKRLCERWLDNLFMLLYDDLRVYTMYKAELLHFDAQQMEMKKTTCEWELTGLVASRLGHKEEAAKCFERGLEMRFSAKCSSKLLEYYTDEREKTSDSSKISDYNDKILELVVKLFVWNHRWYCSFSPVLINALKDLVNEVGRVKLESEIKVRFDDGNTGVYNVVEDNLECLDLYGLIERDE